MSRQITNDHLYTDEEVAYLLQRNYWKEVVANKKQFGGKKVEEPKKVEPLALSKEVFEHVKSLNKEDTSKELEAAGLSTEGTVKEMKVRLAEHLQRKSTGG